jgi:hypothetical protein
MAVHADDATAL